MTRDADIVARGPIVLLRRPRPSDCREMLLRNAASATLYRGLATPMRTAMQFSAYLSRCDREDHEGLLVCRVSDAAIVGAFNLSQIVRGGFQSAYMGYQVFAPFQRQGYMSAAMPLVLRHAFRTLKLHRVEANIQPENRASLKLVRRAGFRREGYSPRYLKIGRRWRDHERWALLSEEWRRGAAPRPASRPAAR